MSKTPPTPKPSPETLAAVDIGSNSVRLLIKRGKKVLARDLVITRLGKGLAAGKTMTAKDVAPTVEVLARYKETMAKHKTDRFRAVATAAVRENPAREKVVALLNESGLTVEVASEEEEAELAYRGAMQDRTRPAWVVDIGGGSTELCTWHEGKLWGKSFKMGSVRLRETFLKHDPPTPHEASALRLQVQKHLTAAPAFLDGPPSRPLAGVAGTVTTVYQMLHRQKTFIPAKVHRGVMRRGELEKLFGELMGMTVEQRLGLPGLPAQRADVIPAGLGILLEVMARLKKPQVTVSCLDNLDAIIAGLEKT